MVICIHSDISDLYTNKDISDGLVSFCSYYITAGAVPSFFFISGYLFCKNGLSFGIFVQKLKNRVKTLLIPYILWTLIAFVVLSVKYLPCFESYFENLNKVPYNLHLFIMSFIDRPVPEGFVSTHDPLLFPLWYVRDLMLLVLITPVIYFFRRYSMWVIATLGIVSSFVFVIRYEIQIWPLLFYTAGCYYMESQMMQKTKIRDLVIALILGGVLYYL